MRWSFDWCVWFLSQLTLVEGGPLVLEPFQLLVLREFFVTGRVELLVLLPKGNGKTLLFAGVAVFHLLTVSNAQAFVGAADREQADQLFQFAQHFAEGGDSPKWVQSRLIVRAATREIRVKGSLGKLKVLASDSSQSGGKRHSFNPTLALIDELHAHDKPHLYTAMRSAVFKRRGLIVVISTAGHDELGVLGQMRSGYHALDTQGGTVEAGLAFDPDGSIVRGTDGRLTLARTPVDPEHGAPEGRGLMLEWACRGIDDPQGADDLECMETVKLANPASFVTVSSLRDLREAPGVSPWDFARYRANVWTLGAISWLPDGLVGERMDPEAALDPEGGPVFVFVDMGRYSDSAAVVCVQDQPGGPLAEPVFYRESGGHDDPIPYPDVRAAIRAACETFPVHSVGYDPKYLDETATILREEGLPMAEFPQSPERMGAAWRDLREDLVGARLRLTPGVAGVHYGRHLVAGKLVELGEDLFKVVKPSPQRKIDLAAATAGANRLRHVPPALKKRPRPFMRVIA